MCKKTLYCTIWKSADSFIAPATVTWREETHVSCHYKSSEFPIVAVEIMYRERAGADADCGNCGREDLIIPSSAQVIAGRGFIIHMQRE